MSSLFSGNRYVWRIDFLESQEGIIKFREDNPFHSVGVDIGVLSHSTFLALPEQDGKTGLLLVSQDNTSLRYQSLRSTGKSLFPHPSKVTDMTYQGNISIGQTTSMTSLDLVNVVHLFPNITQVSVLHFFDGEFVSVKEVTQPSYHPNYGVNFVDLRGLGRMECLFSLYDSISNVFRLSSLPSATTVAPADYIKGYTGGLGATLSVTYGSLTDSTVYTQSADASGSANPYVNALSRFSSSRVSINSSTLKASDATQSGSTRTQLIRFPKYVVTQVTSSMQRGINSNAGYRYKNARVAFDGRGWLGFETIVQTSDVLGTATTNTYMQQFPFVGQMSKTETQDVSISNNPVPLKTETYDWASHPTHGTGCYTTIASVRQTSYEKGRESYSVNLAHRYDDYANLTETTITIAGKFDLVISQQYDNDASNWIIGSKLSETVTSNNSRMKETRFTYLDGTQSPEKIENWVANSSFVVEGFVYDKAGNVIKSTGPSQEEKTFTYDRTYYFPITVTTAVDDKSSLTTSTTYDYVHGEKASETQPNGHTQVNKYDVLGRLVEISEGQNPETVVEKREYKLLDGDAVCVRSTLCDLATESWSTETEYLDGMERTWKKATPNTSALSDTVVYSEVLFDGAGRITREYRNYTNKTSDPVFVAYSYDALSRKTRAVFPPATSTAASPVTMTYDYNFTGGQATVTETKSDSEIGTTTTKTVVEYFQNIETGSHDFLVPLTVALVDEQDQTITTGFDALHRVVSTTDPSGVCLSQEWDGLSRMTCRKISNPSEIQPGVINHFSISYDDSTGVKTITNECTDTQIVFLQDRLNRVTKRTGPDEETTYTYDDVAAGAQGQISSITSLLGVSESFSYDSRGSLQTSSLTIDEETFTTSFEYTTGYAISKISNPDNSGITYTFFDNSNIVKKVQLQDGRSNTSASCTFSQLDNGFFSPRVSDMGNGLTSTVTLADNGVPLEAILSKDSATLLQQSWTLDSYSRIKTYNPGPSSSNDTRRTFEYTPSGQWYFCLRRVSC
jgi:YD repeat-containing protein